MNNDSPVAAGPAPSTVIHPSSSPESPPSRRARNPLQWFKNLSKKQKVLVSIAVILLLSGIGTGIWAVANAGRPQPVAKVTKKTAAPVDTNIYSPLTGQIVTAEQSKRPVTGIMIENSPDARPQSGLLDSGMVFEAIAEGGITRFLTLHQEDQPAYIGPIRSARPYFIDWVEGFDAGYVHAGGSADALVKIQRDGVKDLTHSGNYFYRVNSRYAPHNLYSDMGKLDAYGKSKGYTSSTFTHIPHKKKADKLTTPTARLIDFAISGPLYNVHYDYDAASNTYLRSEGDKPHVDERSNKQLSPNVVIAIVMQFKADYNGVNSWYNSIGSGKTYVFQGGGVTEGTWSKTSAKSQISFKDASGKDILLSPGQTWVTAVNSIGDVSYKP